MGNPLTATDMSMQQAPVRATQTWEFFTTAANSSIVVMGGKSSGKSTQSDGVDASSRFACFACTRRLGNASAGVIVVVGEFGHG